MYYNNLKKQHNYELYGIIGIVKYYIAGLVFNNRSPVKK